MFIKKAWLEITPDNDPDLLSCSTGESLPAVDQEKIKKNLQLLAPVCGKPITSVFMPVLNFPIMPPGTRIYFRKPHFSMQIVSYDLQPGNSVVNVEDVDFFALKKIVNGESGLYSTTSQEWRIEIKPIDVKRYLGLTD